MKSSHGTNNPSFGEYDAELYLGSETDDSEYVMNPKTYDDPYLVYCKDCGNNEFWLAIKDGIMTIKCNLCGESVKHKISSMEIDS